jgi:hypothetical protein
MSAFISTNSAAEVNLYLLRRDYFDGFSLLLQDSNGTPLDLNEVQVCASVWKSTTSGTVEQVLSINVEEQEPLNAGRIRLWLSSAQSAALWDAAQYVVASGVFFPSAYASQVRPFLSWDVRIEQEESVADLVSVSAGAFISQTNHTLAASERVVFRDTNQSSINYNGTTARIYTGLTGISYQPPYAFTVPALSGITDAAIGGTAYRLKQDTVVAGSVIVGTTLSNCFP